MSPVAVAAQATAVVRHLLPRFAAARIGVGAAVVATAFWVGCEAKSNSVPPVTPPVAPPIKADKGLLEADFGDWTGQELAKLMKLPEWSTVQRAPSTFRFPGGESFTEMQNRIVGALDRLRAMHPGGVVVAVSHADPIKAAVAHAMGTHLDLFQRIVISPCSITAIAYHTAGPVVLTVNSTGGSLADLRPS